MITDSMSCQSVHYDCWKNTALKKLECCDRQACLCAHLIFYGQSFRLIAHYLCQAELSLMSYHEGNRKLSVRGYRGTPERASNCAYLDANLPHIPHNTVDPCSGPLSGVSKLLFEFCRLVSDDETLERPDPAIKIGSGNSLGCYTCSLVERAHVLN